MTLEELYNNGHLAHGLANVMSGAFFRRSEAEQTKLWELTDEGLDEINIDDDECVTYKVNGEVLFRVSLEDIAEAATWDLHRVSSEYA